MDVRQNMVSDAPQTSLGVKRMLVLRLLKWYPRGMPKDRRSLLSLHAISGAEIAAARERTGLSQSEFSRQHGINQQVLSKIERYVPGKTIKATIKGGEVKAFLVQKLGLQPHNTDAMTKIRQGALGMMQEARGGAFDLPFFRPRLTQGAIMAVGSTPSSLTKRPPYLDGVEDSYAIEMIGDSMLPAFHSGDYLYVNRTVSPSIGRACIFLTTDRRSALVRILVGQTEKVWQIRQLNPANSPVADLDRRLWPSCEVIEGAHFADAQG
jgi:SOS-response transcriptional repressor LexA